ncbi:MAG: hypothetical protein ABFR05_00380 [Bacteroidota bacterium]
MKENKNILKNLKNSGAGFSVPEGYFDSFKVNLEKHRNGFKVPDSYFDDVEDKIFDNLNSSKTPKETGFSIPDNYLKEFDIKDLKANKSPKVIRIFSTKSFKVASMAIAASFILFLGVKQFNKQDSTSFDDLTITEIENWIDEDMIVLNTYDIEDTYKDLEIETQINFNDNEILDYLTDKDLEQLIIEN